MIKYCGSCALRTQDNKHCGITGLTIDPDKDFCSKHNAAPSVCEGCGDFIPTGQFLTQDKNNEYHIFCANCISALNTCSGCTNSEHCDFRENPSPLPFKVQRKIQQGPMIAVTEILNPERVEITCKKGCECFDTEKGCLRQNNWCEHYCSVI